MIKAVFHRRIIYVARGLAAAAILVATTSCEMVPTAKEEPAAAASEANEAGEKTGKPKPGAPVKPNKGAKASTAASARSGGAAESADKEDNPAADAKAPPGSSPPSAAEDTASLPPPEPEIDSNPNRLLGLDRAAVTGLLGVPGFARSEAPAQLWRYRDERCLLDLFLYGDENNAENGAVVRHYEVRSVADPAVSPSDCLRALLLARMKGKAG